MRKTPDLFVMEQEWNEALKSLRRFDSRSDKRR
jgi:hypothetical protein